MRTCSRCSAFKRLGNVGGHCSAFDMTGIPICNACEYVVNGWDIEWRASGLVWIFDERQHWTLTETLPVGDAIPNLEELQERFALERCFVAIETQSNGQKYWNRLYCEQAYILGNDGAFFGFVEALQPEDGPDVVKDSLAECARALVDRIRGGK
jgi:hypothetical protein